MNPRLINVVTAHLDEFQGLRTVTTGVFVASVAFVGSMPADPVEGVVWLIVSLVPMLFVARASRALPAYYARTGHVVRTRAARLSSLLFGVWIGFSIAAGQAPSHGFVSAMWVIWAMYPIRLVWSAWPYRMHHVLTFAASLYILWDRMTGPLVPAVADWARHLEVLALALVITGLADHMVLMRAVPGAFRLKAETTETE